MHLSINYQTRKDLNGRKSYVLYYLTRSAKTSFDGACLSTCALVNSMGTTVVVI